MDQHSPRQGSKCRLDILLPPRSSEIPQRILQGLENRRHEIRCPVVPHSIRQKFITPTTTIAQHSTANTTRRCNQHG